MLSYRHAFHAGNHADVLKHSVLCYVLDYMRQKPGGFVYVDTHAGAGSYDLRDAWADKNREYEHGIGALLDYAQTHSCPAALEPYLDLVQSLNPPGALHIYPGSPQIADHMLRAQDSARLFELHPHEYQALSAAFSSYRHFTVEKRDGLQALHAVLPPAQRRALILIDPAYEVKTDYRDVVRALQSAHRKFSGGVYMLWYPVVARRQVDTLERAFIDSGMRNILQAELLLRADTDHGMTASGLIIINPPWQLAAYLQQLLPCLRAALAGSDGAHRIVHLVAQ
jgi:23S rRNA (adenine2030-N6)-methyltransferase